tara:strand:- start:148 stop:438 length:291 start_codon:yes stop_codon:yes gene_type:complete
MTVNKKYFIYSLIFIVSFSIHSFVDHHEHQDHHDHHSFEKGHIAECQACEENVDLKSYISKKNTYLKNVLLKTSLYKKFLSSKNKSNLSRAPPYKS